MTILRRPGGTPDGGKFAPQDLDEAEGVELNEVVDDQAADFTEDPADPTVEVEYVDSPEGDGQELETAPLSERQAWIEEYNAGHSYFEPPYPAAPDQIIDFWMNAEIPPEICNYAFRRFFYSEHRSMIPTSVRAIMAGIDGRQLRLDHGVRKDDPDEQAVLNTVLEWPNGYRSRIWDFLNDYKMWEIYNAHDLLAPSPHHAEIEDDDGIY